MLCIWWDVQGVIYFELLPPNTSITAAYYLRSDAEAHQQTPHGKARALSFPIFCTTQGHMSQRSHGRNCWIWVGRFCLTLHIAQIRCKPTATSSMPWETIFSRKSSRMIDNIDWKLTDFFNSQPAQFYRDGIRSLLIVGRRWLTVMAITLLNEFFCFFKKFGCMECSWNGQNFLIDPIHMVYWIIKLQSIL